MSKQSNGAATVPGLPTSFANHICLVKSCLITRKCNPVLELRDLLFQIINCNVTQTPLFVAITLSNPT